MSIQARVAPAHGAARVRRAIALAGCGVLAVGVSACESTEQESAKIGRESQVAAAQAAPHPSRRSHRSTRGHASPARAPHTARGGTR